MAIFDALIFAKYPEPGAVKTRLVPPLTYEQAARLHRASLLTVCEQVGQIEKTRPVLVFTPDDRLSDFRQLAERYISEYRSQGEGDLGGRLARAVEEAFRGGTNGVLLFGADSPTLPKGYMERAISGLQDHDAVLGPTDDGGYYLLGLSRPCPELFGDISWGTDSVADQTRRRATEAGFSIAELPLWYDLDRFDDLTRARRDLDETEQTGMATDELCGLLLSLTTQDSSPHPGNPCSSIGNKPTDKTFDE